LWVLTSIKKQGINNKETRMVKDGEDFHGLQTTNLKNLGLAFQDAQTVHQYLTHIGYLVGSRE